MAHSVVMQLLCSPDNRSDKIKGLLSQVKKGIDGFSKFWPKGPRSDYAREVEPDINDAINAITYLVDNNSMCVAFLITYGWFAHPN